MAVGDLLSLNSGAGAVAVPLAGINESTEGPETERAFSGAARTVIRYRKSEWRVRTRPMTRTDGDALRAVLEATPPITATGTVVGSSTSVHINDIAYDDYPRLVDSGAMTDHVVLSFTMLEE